MNPDEHPVKSELVCYLYNLFNNFFFFFEVLAGGQCGGLSFAFKCHNI